MSGTYKRKIWTEAKPDEIWEPRCSFCGKYRKSFKFHWFFTGLYCVRCIQEVLYNDVRSIEEMEK